MSSRSRFAIKIVLAALAAISLLGISAPANAVVAEARAVYVGCDLIADETGEAPNAKFATSFRSIVTTDRTILFRKVGTDGFGDVSPVPANVVEGRIFLADSNGFWQVKVWVGTNTNVAPIAQVTTNVNCPGFS